MKNEIEPTKPVWAKPGIREIEATDEILAHIASANGISLKELKAMLRRGHGTRVKAA